ncbi:hypothetical protein HDU76_009998 [Blyttiomyces sp. JEL0837]|nr:hypothetical protein HDU76_009998 [Blyttiomyces sp. JEL0837]
MKDISMHKDLGTPVVSERLLIDMNEYLDIKNPLCLDATPLWHPSKSTSIVPFLLNTNITGRLAQPEPVTFRTFFYDINPMTNVVDVSPIEYVDYSALLLNGLEKALEAVKERVDTQNEKLAEKSRLKNKPLHKYQVAERAWLAVPLSGAARHEQLPDLKNFCTDGLIVGDHVAYRVHETFPRAEIVGRLVNPSRLRPITERLPVDPIEESIMGSKEDIIAEIESWKNAQVLRRRPTGNQRYASGAHPDLYRCLDEDVQADEENPIYEVKKC